MKIEAGTDPQSVTLTWMATATGGPLNVSGVRTSRRWYVASASWIEIVVPEARVPRLLATMGVKHCVGACSVVGCGKHDRVRPEPEDTLVREVLLKDESVVGQDLPVGVAGRTRQVDAPVVVPERAAIEFWASVVADVGAEEVGASARARAEDDGAVFTAPDRSP